MTWFFWAISFVVAFALAGPLLKLIEDRLIHRDDGHTRRMREHRDSGATYQEAADDLFLREAMALLRREASDLVRKDPTLWIEALGNKKHEALEFVSLHRKHLVPAFIKMLDGLSYGQILYPHEAQMVDRLNSGHTWSRPNVDQHAALKIVKPG